MNNIEIERKFLVCDDSYRQLAYDSSRIKQGYICSGHGRTVRVRIRGDRGYLTIKGASDEKGLSRYEFEKEITLDEAEQLFKLCELFSHKPTLNFKYCIKPLSLPKIY